ISNVRALTVEALSSIAPSLSSPHMHEHRGRLGVVVAEAALPQHWSIERLAKSLHNKLQAASEDPVCVYVGGAVPRLVELQQAYSTAKETMLYKYADESRFVFLYDELRDRPLQ